MNFKEKERFIKKVSIFLIITIPLIIINVYNVFGHKGDKISKQDKTTNKNVTKTEEIIDESDDVELAKNKKNNYIRSIAKERANNTSRGRKVRTITKASKVSSNDLDYAGEVSVDIERLDEEANKKIAALNIGTSIPNFDIDGTMNQAFERYAMYDIKMPVEHQKYLYKLCQERDLDYIKTLAILKHESQFNANAINYNKNGSQDHGYMQINTINHDRLAKEVGTPKKPLDPYINLNWGTYELRRLKTLYSNQGLTGRALFEAVQSGYNKGVYGFKKYGKAERYIQRTDRELAWLKEKLDL